MPGLSWLDGPVGGQKPARKPKERRKITADARRTPICQGFRLPLVSCLLIWGRYTACNFIDDLCTLPLSFDVIEASQVVNRLPEVPNLPRKDLVDVPMFFGKSLIFLDNRLTGLKCFMW